MGLLNTLRAMIGRGPRSQSFDLTAMTPDQLREFLRMGGSMATASGAVVNETTAMRVAAAWRCVNIIAGTVSSLPLDLIRRESETVRMPAEGHPLRQVLTVKPNTWQAPNEFKRMMQAHLLLRGNAYARKVMSGARLIGLIPIHPDRVQVEQANDLSLTYSVSRPDGQVLKLRQRDVLHLRGMSLDGIAGLSVLSHMREALGLALQAEQAGAKLFKNGSFGNVILKHPMKLSPEAAASLRDSFTQVASGAENAGKAILLEEGMDVAPVAMTAADTQFLQNREFQRYDIAMFFGVPPHMIGATEKTTSWGSGIEQQGIGFVTYTLNDWLVIWQEAIKRDLIPEQEWDALDARFFVQGLLKGDVKARWDAYVKGMQWGVYSPDDVRAMEDQNPRPDGMGGVYYDPPNTAGSSSTNEGSTNDPAQPA
ncbi:phage portal protein [Xanthobacter sp. V0B-10]|uniref:phage portal protein n=1 Tax=Xanthobacter albus TaxID=3119929 RepID=UPI00372C2CE5